MLTGSKCLGDEKFKLTTSDGRDVVLAHKLTEIYVFCVLSDHYPALSFQARQFLKITTLPRLQPPLVTDVFTIDAMTEMLQSPLHFLSYVNRRANYAEQILSTHELSILGYHLKQNLWMNSDVNVMHVGDDFTAGLDVAMAVRRRGLAGAATPDGILTRVGASTLDRVVRDIEARPEPAIVELGFLLLAFSDHTYRDTSRAIDELSKRAKADGKNHDLTLGFRTRETGLTVHCNDDLMQMAMQRLQWHCERRKYKERARQWFGLCVNSIGPNVRAGLLLSYTWEQNNAQDEATQSMQSPKPVRDAFAEMRHDASARLKTGRNERCPCGSGLKYKKCCLGA